MRTLSPATLAALDSGRYVLRSFVRFDLDAADGGPFSIWDDIHAITIGSVTFEPWAGRFQLSTTPSAADFGVRNCDITFSGLDDPIKARLLALSWHQRSVTMWVGVAPVAAPLTFDMMPWFIGFMDSERRRERADAPTDLIVRCESIGRELNRKGARVRADADQRQIDATDGFFKHVTQVINDTPQWGRAGGGGTGGGAGKRSFLDKLF